MIQGLATPRLLTLALALALGTGCSSSSFTGSGAKLGKQGPGQGGKDSGGDSDAADGDGDARKNDAGDSDGGADAGLSDAGGADSGADGGVDSGSDSGSDSDAGGMDAGEDEAKVSENDDEDGFIKTDDGDASVKAPKFAMLLNDVRCAMCHLTIKGDVASTQTVNTWNDDANNAQLADHKKNLVMGAWFAAKGFSTTTPAGQAVQLDVASGIKTNYMGKELPHDPNTGAAVFPTLDYGALKAKTKGTVKGKDQAGKAVAITNSTDGNVTLVGTEAAPIELTGDVYVGGDLVIKGWYKGVGSIYVAGRIYIPANLRAVTSVFPYPDDAASALAAAKDLVKARKGDALGLATAESIFLGDLKTGLYDDARAPANARRQAAGVDHVYGWFPGGQGGYEALYEKGEKCDGSGNSDKPGINLVEAYLYARASVGGISHDGSWAINGGVISDSLHIIGRAGKNHGGAGELMCPNPVKSTVHKLPMNRNYVNFDWRMKAGLRLLSKFSAYYGE